MPWDGTDLVLADVRDDGTFGAARVFAGGPEESIAQVEWAPDGRLLFSGDRTGWWNLYRASADDPCGVHALCPREEEFAGPLWQTGLTWFAPLGQRADRRRARQGRDRARHTRPRDR